MKLNTILLSLFWCLLLQEIYAQAKFAQLENYLLPAVQIQGEPVTRFSIEERMKHYHVPGMSIAIIQDGKITWAKGYGVSNTESNQPVDEHTLFQAGSISKPVAAMGALSLVQAGQMELEQDINSYLSRWHVPSNRFTQKSPVHLKGLLSHTAGMTVHGFPGYTQQEEFPSVETVLEGKGNTAAIVPDTTAGSIWRYSGGGYTVAQLAVEEVAGEPFAKYLQKAVLAPLEMHNSTFQQPLPEALQSNTSAAFDSKGNMAEGLWNNYPELAAAGLWTTPTDLAKFCIAIQNAYQGNAETVLNQDLTQTMLTEVRNEYGLGLGIHYQGDTLLFGHGGKNRGFSNNMRASANYGFGMVVMTNADEGGNLASEIFRGAQKVFNWGIPRQQLIEKYKLSVEAKVQYLGTYRLEWQDTDNYWVEVKETEQGIMIYDPQSTSNFLIPTSSTDFRDRDSGRPVKFELDETGKAVGFLYAGTYPFKRVDL